MPNRPVVASERSMLSTMPMSKAAAGLAVYEGASKLYTSARDFWRSNFAYTVTVQERDLLYPDVHAWLLSIMPNEKHRSLLVSSSRISNDGPVSEEEDNRPQAKPLILRFNDDSPRKVIIDGHRVSVRLHTPEETTSNSYREPQSSKIYFTTSTHEAQQAVIRHLQCISDERATTRKAVLRMVNQWGSWRTRSDLPPRTLDSVALPPEQKSRIVQDLHDFLGAEEQYNRLAIPWHRGYMFHGPPGTGKTSLVKALANYFNLDLWYISLADLKAESSLLGLLSEVSPRSLLLLEDIDTMKITQDRDGSEQGTISMSSLLNTLDGVATPHGLITVMTTNRFEVLDTALTRAGRMDLVEELGYPSGDTLAELFKHFYGRYPQYIGSAVYTQSCPEISSAEVSEVFKRHLDDPITAELEVEKLVRARINSS